MRKNPQPNEIYKHFKGNLYRIITLASHSETGETMVVYQALYGDYKAYVRELSMFMSKTDKGKYPQVQQKYRFEKIPEIGELTTETKENAETETRKLPAGIKENAGTETRKLPAGTKENAETETRKLPDGTKENAETETGKLSAGIKENIETKIKETTSGEELGLDPLLLEFLDADTCRERLNLLSAMHPYITDAMLDTMAAALEVEVGEGDIEERYAGLRNCLLMIEKYECSRLR